MPRKSPTPTNGNSPAEPAAPIIHRTRLNVLTIVRFTAEQNQDLYLAVVNGKVSAAFSHDTLNNHFLELSNAFHAFIGLSDFYKHERLNGTVLLVTKSPDEDVVLAQSANDAVKAFILNYIDRKAIKLAKEQDEPVSLGEA